MRGYCFSTEVSVSGDNNENDVDERLNEDRYEIDQFDESSDDDGNSGNLSEGETEFNMASNYSIPSV